MSSGRHTVRDLVEEGKKRAVLLIVCGFGLAYLMSLTSSSVWVNLPAATALIIFFRYISLEFDVRRRTQVSKKQSLANQSSGKKSVELSKIPLQKPNWRGKVNSAPVEVAIDQFTRHLVREWIADLWYSRITPDKDGPEQLVQILNGVFGEVSRRARDINLIDLLTRDIINLLCNHMELYRSCQAKIGKQESAKLSFDYRDIRLRLVLEAEKKLHPALFSAKAEHKVLQQLMDGFISFVLKPEDLNCVFFRYTVRELLACAVIRPVLNMANPRFINEKIESLVLSLANKADKGVKSSAEEASPAKPSGPPRIPAVQHSGLQDPSTVGVELVQFKQDCFRSASGEKMSREANGTYPLKDSSSNMSTSSSICHTNLVRADSRDNDGKKTNCGNEWAQTLDMVSRRKTQTLAPENIENIWTKGRNYRKKEGANQVSRQGVHNASAGILDAAHHQAKPSKYFIRDRAASDHAVSRINGSVKPEDLFPVVNLNSDIDGTGTAQNMSAQNQERAECQDEFDSSESSCPTEDDDNNNVTGLHSPGTRVWESKSKRDPSGSRIRHPLETPEFHLGKRNGKQHVRHSRTSRTSSGRKRSRSSDQKLPIWQEVERSSFLLGDGQDILHASSKDTNVEELTDDPEVELWGRINSGAAASSSASSISVSGSSSLSLQFTENSVLADSFLKLRCEVTGASIVKSGSGTLAVYSISVTDGNSNSWSIKRRFRHFEELHRRLKEFPEYSLTLPPKHFLSTGLEVPLVQERCKLLDNYLKKLLQLPTISGSIEVWDFLSVDSQTYMFANSLSIIQTLSVDLHEKTTKDHPPLNNLKSQLPSRGESMTTVGEDYVPQTSKNYTDRDNLKLRKRNTVQNDVSVQYSSALHDNSGSDSENRKQKYTPSSKRAEKTSIASNGEADRPVGASQILETADDLTRPTEWVPPNLSVPFLNLVDVIFQLQDGGWIRRQAFWVAKQLLQLGMGDAFDDWLMEKIQLLQKGSVIASAINRVEQILWPDGIFITKHPSRKPQTPVASPKEGGSQKDSTRENLLTKEQQLEATRRAKFVHELIIVKAPAALVSLVGCKEYERCAEDVYCLLQSPVFLKQLAFQLMELLLLSAFPELDDVVEKCHREQYAVVEENR